MKFYRYWEYSKRERLNFLGSYKEKVLPTMPYWEADWSFNSKGIFFKPQAPFKDIIEWGKQTGRAIKIMLPLGPCPLLPEGGLPHKNKIYLKDSQGIHLALANSQGVLNHLISPYGKEIPSYYYAWLESLKKLCEREKLIIHWELVKSYYPDKHSFKSYMEDSSRAFENSFVGFVQKNDFQNKEVLLEEKESFREMLEDFYLESAKEHFDEDDLEIQSLCFMRGGAESPFKQYIRPYEELSDISLDFCRTYTYGMTPHFAFASQIEKVEEAWDFFQKISFSGVGVAKEKYMENLSTVFRPLRLFRLWGDRKKSFIEESASELKLTTFFFNFFRWTYEMVREVEFSEENIEEITFCFKEELSENDMRRVAKAFSLGHKIILFQESLTSELWNFWKSFILENKYFSEEVVYQGKISYFSNNKGGQVAILSRISLSRLGVNLAVELWEKMMEFFQVEAFKIQHSEGVNYFWETRGVRGHELNYKEVRRVLIQNTEKLGQRVHLKKNTHGSLIRVSERRKAKISVDEENIWIELGSLGLSILEFGMIEA